MDEQDLKYFGQFLAEFQKESERGAALVGAALLDARLERILRSHFIEGKCADELLDGGNAPLGSFSSRIKCCYALGLIAKNEKHDLELIRAVRNAFAHQEHGLTFESNKIRGLCASLASRRPLNVVEADGYSARARFTDAVIFNSMQLWYRPEYAQPLKCVERSWPY
ncbi:MltR family transcriptional regulator [Burkholderia gladioli]|uniref:MltR family transcriptional regulator n=1 Tax=Burkholderia gladioli TaxID=28095 RepID=UPI00163E1470|nr:MltR family transcriptional regulator [Burkholderia gladioli]